MVLTGIFLMCLHFVLTRQNGVREYCHEEDFKASCGENEIIMMESAVYGRMRAGRCITNDYTTGCFADALHVFDRFCSGKPRCTRQVLDSNINVDVPCSSELERYLQASYLCLSVFPIQQFCNIEVGNKDASTSSESVSHLKGTIVPSEVLRSHCGGDLNPLVIQALPGQQFQVTMIDFYWSNSTSQICNIKYGQILDLESGESKSLCGGRGRRTNLMLTSGHRLQMKFESHSSTKFILMYEVRNCPTTLNMVNGWFQSEGMTGEAGCHDNDKTWHLTCDGNTWRGLDGDCLEKKGHVGTVAGIDITHELLVMAGSAVVLFISAVILIVGCCYIRSYCKRKPPAVPPEMYYSRDFQFMRTCDNCDTSRRDNQKPLEEQQQETSFSHPSDTRYRSLHPNGMQGRPLPEIPEYDVPAGARRDEQETLLVRGKANDADLPNDVILPSDLNLPSERALNTDEETRRMQSMIRGHPNNMTLFSGTPSSRMPKNPRLYASTMGRVLRDHPNMVRQPKFVQPPNVDHLNMPPQTQLPKETPKILAPQPDVIRVERIHTEDGDPETPVPIYSDELSSVPQGQGQTQLQPQQQTNGPLDGAQNNPQSNLFRSLVHHGPRYVERPLSV